MAEYLIQEETLTNLANSVRTLSGSEESMTPDVMVATVNETKSAIDMIDEHKADINNPHAVTADQVGAATTEHIHDWSDMITNEWPSYFNSSSTGWNATWINSNFISSSVKSNYDCPTYGSEYNGHARMWYSDMSKYGLGKSYNISTDATWSCLKPSTSANTSATIGGTDIYLWIKQPMGIDDASWEEVKTLLLNNSFTWDAYFVASSGHSLSQTGIIQSSATLQELAWDTIIVQFSNLSTMTFQSNNILSIYLNGKCSVS